jgi:hypothetical protein
VNAAYLMLTTAWLAGQTQPPAAQPAPMGQPAAPAAQPAPAGTYAGPVASTSLGACNGGWGGCGGGCATDCCDSGRKGLLSRLCGRGRNDCGCAPAPAPVHHHASSCCAPAPVANDCGCERHGLCAKLKDMLHRNRGGCGCDSGCGSTSGCGCGGATYGGGVIGGGVISTTPAEAIPAQPKPGEAPRRMPGTGGTPMTINGGVIRDVTPVVAPRLSIEQPF